MAATCDVNVHLSDVMTPRSFSTVVATLIKYLVYEKQLIPYPYDRLKLYVEKYNELNVQNHCTNQQNKYRLESDKYYKKVSNAIDTMETVFKCIEHEFLSCMKNHIETVTILIGSSILNPLTVFNIHVPELSYSHCEKQHSSRRHVDNVFKNILNNDKFNDILTSNIMVEANLYVMFKVKKGAKMNSDWCVPKEQFRCFRGKQVVFNFDSPQNEAETKPCCFEKCLNFEVYVDIESCASSVKPIDDGALKNNVVDWYLGKYHISGFKNYKYNGVPISDTWLNPKLLIV